MTNIQIIQNLLKDAKTLIERLEYKCEHKTLSTYMTEKTFDSISQDIARAKSVYRNIPKKNVVDALNNALDIIEEGEMKCRK